MGKLRAGAGKACITPPSDMFPAQFFLPLEFGGVYKDLYVRVLLLDNGEKKLAMIAYDAADMSRTEDLCKALHETYGLEKESLCFAATHSHEAPCFAYEHEFVRDDPKKLEWTLRYGDFVIGQTIKAVGSALEFLRPAQYCFGTGKSYVNVCRDELFEDGIWGQGVDFAGPSDKTLAILQIRDMDDNIIAGLLNYGVHGTCCFMKKDEQNQNYLIAGDFPGMVSEYLEKRYQDTGSIFLWTSGAAANQNPIFFAQYIKYNHDKSHVHVDMGYKAWDLCEHLAQRQGVDAVKIMDDMKDFHDVMDIRVSERNVILPGQEVIRKRRDESGVPINEPSSVEIVDAGSVEMRLKLVALDHVAFLGMNAELVAEIGMRLKAVVPYKDFVIVTHTGERIGYIPDKYGYDRRTFAFYASLVKDGCTEEKITPVILEMCEDVLQKKEDESAE